MRVPLIPEQEKRVKTALKRGGCMCPGICASFPYSCGCGFLVNSDYDTVESIQRLAEGKSLKRPKRKRSRV